MRVARRTWTVLASTLVLLGLRPVPAEAAGTGEVTLVHGVRGLVADVVLDGRTVLQAFEPERLTDPLSLGAGSHQVQVRTSGAPAGTPPLLDGTLTVVEGARRSAVVHLSEAGAPALTVFDDDASAVPAGRARVVVRHVAAAPGLQVTIDDGAARALGSGSETTFDVAAGPHVIGIRDATSAAPLAPRSLDFAAGSSMALYLVGTASTGSLTWLAEVLPVASAPPTAVRTGNSPVPGEGSSAWSVAFAIALGVSTIGALGAGLASRRPRLAAAGDRARTGRAGVVGVAGFALGFTALAATRPGSVDHRRHDDTSTRRARDTAMPAGLTAKVMSAPAPKGGVDARTEAATIVVPPAVRAAGIAEVAAALATSRARPAPRSVAVEPGGIVATVIGVGADAANGEMQIPPDPSTVGWYEPGARPGDAGSAVLAGHVAFDGRAGAFADLVDVEVGAVVLVAYDDDTARAFRVRERRAYAKSDLPVADLFRHDGTAQLVLITCGGSFDHRARAYRDNIVLVADPV